MKKISVIAACVLMVAGAIACKKSSSTTTTPTPTLTTGTFTYKVDGGAMVTADSANALIYNLPHGARWVDVYAYKGGVEVMELHFPPLVTTSADAQQTYLETPTTSYDSQSGSLTITTCDTVGNKIAGDFNFVGKVYPYAVTSASHTITEGHMTVTKVAKK